jgi:predicted nuclease with TOPRIM domain
MISRTICRSALLRAETDRLRRRIRELAEKAAELEIDQLRLAALRRDLEILEGASTSVRSHWDQLEPKVIIIEPPSITINPGRSGG